MVMTTDLTVFEQTLADFQYISVNKKNPFCVGSMDVLELHILGIQVCNLSKFVQLLDI